MVLKLPKKAHFLQICDDLSKKSKSIKVISLYPPKRPHHALSENSMFYRGLSNSLQDMRLKTSKKVLPQQRFNKIHQLQTISSKLYIIA